MGKIKDNILSRNKNKDWELLTLYAYLEIIQEKKYIIKEWDENFKYKNLKEIQDIENRIKRRIRYILWKKNK